MSTDTGSFSRDCASLRISVEKVAEKSSVWRRLVTSADDLADVGQEAHVEHPVGLVEDEDLDLGQVDRALADVVEQPARRGHEDLDAGLQVLGLRLDRHAAVDHRVAQRHVPAVGAEAVEDLDGQLARRRDDQRAHRMARRREARVGVGAQALEHRQRESGGLAGAGLGAAHQVAALEHQRNGLVLDRGRDRS